MNKRNSSYKQIVKSTGVFGGVQIINTIIGIARNKLGAILLGPDGIGLIGIYQNVIDLIRLVSNLGINTGGVRDIASCVDDEKRQAYSISVFRWWAMLTSCLGSLIALVFCYPLSLFGFGDGSYALPVALLSVAVFFISLSFGQSTVLQGLRMIGEMAKASLWGNAAGLVISIAAYFFFGLKGIVPAFMLSGIALFFFTNSYVRKIRLSPVSLSHSVALRQGISNLKLGLYIASVGIISTVSMLFVRSFLAHRLNFDAVGVFNAAWTISFVYPALILQSMGSDFFPRLCSVANSNSEVRKLVNEQTYVALIVIIPIVIVMMLFSQYVLQFFYTSEFAVAGSLLQWQIAGGFFKVLSWPLAFVMLAKGKGKYHLLAEIVFYVAYLGGGYVLFPHYGFVGFGIGYLLAYIVYLAVVALIGVRLCAFGWSKQNLLMSALGLLLILAALAIQLYISDYQLIISALFSLSVIVYVAIMLNRVVDIRELIVKIRKKILG